MESNVQVVETGEEEETGDTKLVEEGDMTTSVAADPMDTEEKLSEPETAAADKSGTDSAPADASKPSEATASDEASLQAAAAEALSSAAVKAKVRLNGSWIHRT